jgi:Domain of unknown function (DUF4178)
MPLQNANCPNCGAPVLFRWEHAIQTTCTYCKSILVRTDVDLKLVGRVADLPMESSPVQLGAEGLYRGKSFHAIGRIVYEWAQGIWNEWHILLNDGSSGWLADAQLEFDVSFSVNPSESLPPAAELRPGRQFSWFQTCYEITSLTRARYRGVEGELPFEYWDKSDILFADLRTTDGRFGTIDYSEPQPLLFLGDATDFDALKLRNLRTFEGWTI